jgi:phosphomannomutase
MNISTREHYYTMNAKKTKKYTHLFFDLDGTLTRNKTRITKKMLTRLEKLPQDIVVVSRAQLERVKAQLDGFECFILAQNGNHALFGEEELWQDILKPDKVVEIMNHISSLPRESGTVLLPDRDDLLINKGCSIGYSLLGYTASEKEKNAFDPDHSKRKRLLEKYPLVSDSIEVSISGSTSLNYTRKGRNKGYNIARFIEHLGWEKEDCLYYGDALYTHGNDASVKGVIDTVSVTDPDDTFEKITMHIA